MEPGSWSYGTECRVPIAQKSLSRLSERISNAQQTIFIKNQNFNFNRILVIDDAVGSGTTINESANKLTHTGLKEENNRKIFGYVVVGSCQRFELIKEI